MLTQAPLSISIAVFIGAAVAVWVAGAKLARSADEIAGRTKLARAFLGVILLGGVTSLPEITIAVTATINHNPQLSINDVLGSAATNLLVLAVADVFVRGRPLSSAHQSPQLLLQGVLGMLLLALACGAFIVGDVAVLGVGIWSWVMLAVYLAAMRILATTRTDEGWTAIADDDRKRHARRDRARTSRVRLTSSVVIAAAAILVSGVLLTWSAEAIAEKTGLGSGFFGITFVAIATSLPEVSTVFSAVRLRRYELAIGDVLGTNLFNITIIVLVDALHRDGAVLLDAGRTSGFGALWALVLTAIFLIGMLERRDRTVWRFGIDSIAMLVAYVVGLGVLFALR